MPGAGERQTGAEEIVLADDAVRELALRLPLLALELRHGVVGDGREADGLEEAVVGLRRLQRDLAAGRHATDGGDVDPERLDLVLVVDRKEGRERLRERDAPDERQRTPDLEVLASEREVERRVVLLQRRVDVELRPEGAAHLRPVGLRSVIRRFARQRVGALPEGDRDAIADGHGPRRTGGRRLRCLRVSGRGEGVPRRR